MRNGEKWGKDHRHLGNDPFTIHDESRGRTGTNVISFESVEHHDNGTLSALFDSTEVSPTVAVACAVAELAEKDPLDVGPVSRSVDTSALDGFVRSDHPRTSDVRVQFSVDGYDVDVTSDGHISVRPTAAVERSR